MVKFAVGTGQGSTSATSQLELRYWPCINQSQQIMDRKDCSLHALHPFSHESVGCATTSFVDDAARRAIVPHDAPWGNEFVVKVIRQAEVHFADSFKRSSCTAHASKASAFVAR